MTLPNHVDAIFRVLVDHGVHLVDAEYTASRIDVTFAKLEAICASSEPALDRIGAALSDLVAIKDDLQRRGLTEDAIAHVFEARPWRSVR